MTVEELKTQSDRIMKEVNYSQAMISGDYKTIYYSWNGLDDTREYYPTIICAIDEHGNEYMQLKNVLPNMFWLNTDKIQFNHPRLRTLIDNAYMFSKLCIEHTISELEKNKI